MKKVITGKYLAHKFNISLEHKLQTIIRPITLATILIGNDKASELYVHLKNKACHKVGIKTKNYHLNPHKLTPFILHQLIDELNENPKITGILIEKPYKLNNINPVIVDDWIEPYKDVDGTNSLNMGRLVKTSGKFNEPTPCTPEAILNLLDANELTPFAGKNIAVINRSNILGRPLVNLLIINGAEVMDFNHHMNKEWLYNNDFDIVIAGTGEPDIIKWDFVHTNQVLVPVSEIPMKDGIHGDFSPEAMKKAKLAFKPTGNVGPLCIHYLMENCYKCYLWQEQIFNEHGDN